MVLGTTAENERNFRNWLKKQVYGDGMRMYTDNEIGAYSFALRASCDGVNSSITNFFYIIDPDDFEREILAVKMLPEFDEIDKAGHGTLSTATNLYSYFLNYGPNSVAPEEHAAFYLVTESDDTIKKADAVKEFYYHEVPMKPIQKVFYGAPGTGKSYRVRNFLGNEFPDEEQLRTHVKRVIFHPTYTYGDFVGCIKPLIEQERPLDYQFVAGPFAELLKAAFLNPEEKFYLIIEEINRGNAPAIFGDIFQLLDRNELGKSVYPILSRDLGAYFSRDPWMKNIFYDGMVWLPANFNIIATMNTADDNIFVMDSAFKRRFALEYVAIDFGILPDNMKKERALFYGKRPLKELLMENEGLRGITEKLSKSGLLKRNWATFGVLVNKLIDEENLEKKRAGRPHNALIAENKKLGPFFVSEEELDDRIAFMNKVVFYLKQDVFFDSYKYMTESFEEIFEKYSSEEADIFELLV